MTRRERMKLALDVITCFVLLLCNVCASSASRANALNQVERCVNAKDGFYADGCSNHFYGCANNYTYHMQCPAGLYYHNEGRRCEYKHLVPACGEHKEVQETKVIVTGFSCVGREDGSYAVSLCSGTYMLCRHSSPTEEHCAHNLIYNPYDKRCHNIGAVPSCNPVPEDAEKDLESGELGSICEGRPNEVVALRCSSIYYICSYGTTFKITCPKGTVYDISKSICNYKEQIPSCINISSQSAAPEVPNVAPTLQPVSTAAVKMSPVCENGIRHAKGHCVSEYVECANGILVERACAGDYIFDPESQACVLFSVGCADLLDDHIFEGLPYTCEPGEVIQHGQCKPTYFECTTARKFALYRCPASYLFDPLFKECRSEPLILDCLTGVEELPNSQIEVSAKNLLKTTTTEKPVINFPDFIDDSFDLPFSHTNLDPSVKGNSAYASSSPYASSFNLYAPFLPNWPSFGAGSAGVSPLVSNNDAGWSSYGGVRRMKRSIGTSAASDSYTVDYERSLAETFRCDGLIRDGNYGLPGCRNDYVSCSNGRAILRNCSIGLVYNPSTENCAYVRDVAACTSLDNGVPRNEEASERSFLLGEEASERSLLLAVSKVTVVASGVPKAISTVTCEKDEIFDVGCSPYFIVCLHGVSHTMQCPETSFYDVEKHVCAYRRDVKACEGEAVVEATTAAPTGTTVLPTPKPKKVPMSKAVAAVLLSDDVDCRGMDDGHYGQKCSSQYTTCKAKKGSISYCAGGFSFDLTVLRCVPHKHCGKMNQLLLEVALRRREELKQICERRNETSNQDPCRRDYVICKSGRLRPMRCDDGKVFSNKRNSCVSVRDCSVDEESKAENAITGSSFCLPKVDGVYRHPQNCSRVVQCFKGEGFEHTPCPPNLVFNEVGGVCDYADNVPECNQEHGSHRGLDGDNICKGKKHGAFAIRESCSPLYYHCLWEKPVERNCPDSTVFNPDWNVCDYRSNVKSC